jgi:para-nitrobenzyl esterase
VANAAETTTTAGPVRGCVVEARDRRVHFFGGVPYASAARFGLPQPVAPWTNTRDASVAGAAPPQRIEGLDLVPGMAPATTTEDCLTAEIWTSDTSGSRAVLVWIPGGSFRVGGAGLETYDGRHLAADGDVVVVGLNCRLGLFGFLNAPGVPSNLGLRDLLAGLAWVRANIANFGGDPNRVTVMGESAGAGAIMHLLADPGFAVEGAIVFSGSPTMTQSPATASLVASKVLELAGVASAGDLMSWSVDELLDVQSSAVAALAVSVGMMPFHPWVDGDVVPQSPVTAIATDALAPVPLVIGTTANEMELFRSMVPALPASIACQVLAPKAAALGVSAEGVARGFAACGEDLVSAIADIDLQLPALLLAEHHVRRGLPVWRATFTWSSANHGACHAVDLPFHFGTLDVTEWRAFAAAGRDSAPDADRLSARMRAAWAAFATTGVPSCEPIGTWPQFDGGATTVELGRDVAVVPDTLAERLRAWR